MFKRLPDFSLIALCGLILAVTTVLPVYGENRGTPVAAQNEYSRMAKIPAGKFKMGSTFEETKGFLEKCRKFDKACELWWFKDEYPDHLVTLKTYWIDLYEVSNEKYLEFVRATGHRPALDDSCETVKCREGNLWQGTSFPPAIRNQPVTQVNWFDADSYCRWRGKRLPSEAEWEKAARGSSGSIYPWGSGSPKGRATYLRKWRGVFTMTDVGSYPNGASLYGAYDMAGNVWEWVDDWYHINYYRRGTRKNPRGPARGEFKVVRGGSWVNFPDSLRSAFRRWSRPEVRFNDTGFRCAKDAKDETQKN
ncbi:MAG: formylglycine-generating enzyme family protein [Nitrospinaceae bacterium]